MLVTLMYLAPAGDEALGCYLLKQLDDFKTACVVRSRDPQILAECDIVLDVGGVYDAGMTSRESLWSYEPGLLACFRQWRNLSSQVLRWCRKSTF